MSGQEGYVQFFTAIILEWKQLLKQGKFKQIILDSLGFLVEQKRVKIYGFVPMAIGMINHIHINWHIQGEPKEKTYKEALKYTAQQIKSDLEKHHPKVLPSLFVNAKDRNTRYGNATL